MNENNLKKIEEELDRKIKEAEEKENTYTEREQVAKENQTDYKLSAALVIAMIGYLIASIKCLSMILSGTFNFPNPVLSIPIITMGAPALLGVIGSSIMSKVFKRKKRLNSFSKAKTDEEKLTEEVVAKIELEKAKTRKKVYLQIKDSLNMNRTMYNSISEKYNLESQEENQKKFNELSNYVEKLYKELDILVTKKALHTKFREIRSKFGKVFNSVALIILGGMVPVLLLDFSYIGLAATSASEIYTLSPWIAISLIGATCMGGFIIQKNQKYSKVFNKLNAKLGENALPKNQKKLDTEKQELDKAIENQIKKVDNAATKMYEQKSLLESFPSEEVAESRSNDLNLAIYREDEMCYPENLIPSSFARSRRKK